MRASSFLAVVLLSLALVAACDNTRAATCYPACSATQLCCRPVAGGSGLCANRLLDPLNCGACGNVCLTGQMCINGTCTGSPTDGTRPDSGPIDSGFDPTCTASPSCAAGFMCCGPRCIDADGIPSGDGRADMSFNDCGVCGVMCDAASASRCGRPRGATSGRPVCLCGDFTACTAPRMCLSSGGEFRCVDPLSDATACGDPPVNCTTRNETCSAGTCTCAPAGMSCGTLVCGTTGCIDTQTDETNCGTIGRVCPAGETCTAGSCGCGAGPSCTPGGPFGMCGQVCCVDRCQAVDVDNCGGCGRTCAAGTLCQAPAFGGAASCIADGTPFVIECEPPPDLPDAGVDAAIDPDAGAPDAGDEDASGIDAASDPDAGVDAG